MVRSNVLWLSAGLLAGTIFVLSEIHSRSIGEQIAADSAGTRRRFKPSSPLETKPEEKSVQVALPEPPSQNSSAIPPQASEPDRSQFLPALPRTLRTEELQELISIGRKSGMSEENIEKFIQTYGDEKFRALILARQANVAAPPDSPQRTDLGASASHQF